MNFSRVKGERRPLTRHSLPRPRPAAAPIIARSRRARGPSVGRSAPAATPLSARTEQWKGREEKGRVKGLNRFWRILFSTLKDSQCSVAVSQSVSLAEWRERRRRFTRDDEDGCRQTPARSRGRRCPLSLSRSYQLAAAADVRPSFRPTVHILMADAFFGLHSKEVGSWKGRRPPRAASSDDGDVTFSLHFSARSAAAAGRCHRWPPNPALRWPVSGQVG